MHAKASRAIVRIAQMLAFVLILNNLATITNVCAHIIAFSMQLQQQSERKVPELLFNIQRSHWAWNIWFSVAEFSNWNEISATIRPDHLYKTTVLPWAICMHNNRPEKRPQDFQIKKWRVCVWERDRETKRGTSSSRCYLNWSKSSKY